MILITRPVSQTKNLELLLNKRNIDYALFPAFEIIKIQTEAPVEKYDIIIFISVNAVSYAEEHFDELFSDSSKVFAVGPATANQLLKKNIAVDCFPKKNASSQELLKIKECSELSNRKILIVRGKGGSETLKNYASTLEEARADLVGLYYLMDSMLIDLALITTLDVGKASYDNYIRNGMLAQLIRIDLGNKIQEEHMQNRQLVASWAIEKGRKENVIEKG